MTYIQKYKKKVAQALLFAIAAVLSLPMFMNVTSAAQLSSRSVAMSTAVPGQSSVTYTFTFTPSTAVAIQSMQFQFCDSPIAAACNGTNNPTLGAVGVASQSGWSQTPAWSSPTVGTNAGTGGSATSNQISLTRVAASAETAVAKTIAFNTITNNATANRTFYVRIRLYTDTAYTTLGHDGNVAGSTSQSLTVNARVQENLEFCVGATTVDNATTSVGAACSNVTGTDVDLGIIGNGSVNVTPVSTANGGDNENGVAMVRSNAVNGVVIDYYALQNTSSGKLKVTGATCSGTSTTDQCFNSTGTTQNSIVAGTEEFGMTIAGINCGSANGAYTCTFSSGAYNLVRDAEYDGDGTNTYQTGTANNFAWDDTGTVDRIASSAGSSVKVVDDEAMILKFAAASAITTPTGSYTVQANFIATSTF